MFNREYQKRATRQGLAAREATGEALGPPWAGIFEPWRPRVLIAAANRENKKYSSKRRGKNGRQLTLFDGKLRGVQLSLFPDNDVESFTAMGKFTAGKKSTADSAPIARQLPADCEFPPLANMLDPLSEEDLAAEFDKLFPL